MSPSREKDGGEMSRRGFLKGSAAASAAALLAGVAPRGVHAAGSDRVRVGLIGCGGRGKGAVRDCLGAAKIVGHPVEIRALGDLFEDRAQGGFANLKGWCDEHAKGAFAVTPERVFTGFHNYRKVLDSGVDVVILATPPGFRPIHFRAAVQAGKHVFMEKPVCVDPWGYKQICAAAEVADQKKLTVVAGTQRRHRFGRRETLKRIRDGAIGELVGGQCYWLGGPVVHNRPRPEGMSDVKWQIRNWYAWCWTCGDHIVEQHVHNIDMVLWAFGSPPKQAVAVGGRQGRTEPGNIYDHFAVEFEFPNGARVSSYCSHFRGSSHRVGERVVGTRGRSGLRGDIHGETSWTYEGPDRNPYVQEHVDCLESLLGRGPHWNEGRQVADSSMAAVLGRMSAYTGREISWKWATESSKLRLGPMDMHSFGPFEPHPVAVPGKTKLV